MADVLVDNDAYSYTKFLGRVGPVWVDKDVGYIIQANQQNDLEYRKTTDGGANWGSPVLIGVGTVRASDIWFDKWTPGDSGTKIHIWWGELDSDLLHYRSLDTSDDTLGTDITVFTGVSLNFFDRNDGVMSGTKAVGGNLYIQFWADATGERGFYRSTDNGANWTIRTDGADGDAVDEILCLPDDDSADNQDIVMIYWDRSADEISIKKYDDSDGASGTWGETSISGGMTDYPWHMQMDAVVRHSDGHIILAAWNSRDLATSESSYFLMLISSADLSQ